MVGFKGLQSGDLDVDGTFGEDVTAAAVVTLADGSGADNAGQWYLAASDDAGSLTAELGFAVEATLAGIVGLVRLRGVVTGLSGLVAGTKYYLSATPGVIATPNTGRYVGTALSTTTLFVGAALVLDTLHALMGTTVTLTDGASVALDARLGSVFRLDADGSRTLGAPSGPTDGQKIVIQHFAVDGNRTLTLTTGAGGFRFGTDITALSVTTSGTTDYIGAIYNPTDDRWDVVAYTKGF